MRKVIISLVILLLLFSTALFAQNHPTGQRIVKDQKTDVLYKDIKRVEIKTSLKAAGVDNTAGPSFIDNSRNVHFPPVVDQVGGSCAYASGIGYIYNYEYNVANDLDGSDPDNVVNYLQVYAHLNGGSDTGGHAQLGWQYLEDNGSPTCSVTQFVSILDWATGFEKYYSGMDRGYIDYKSFESDEEGEIEKMKQYLLDHGNGSRVGGLIQFSAYADPFDPTKYEGPKSDGYDGYDAIIPLFGNKGMHSMTIVGFDDNVEYDYYGTIQKGAFICINSWGENWGYRQGCNSDGRFYAPYYAFTTLRQSRNGVAISEANLGGGTGNGGKGCLIVEPKKVEKLLAFKASMKYTSRNDLQIEIGVSNKPGAVIAERTMTLDFMKYQGGDENMRGKVFSSYKTIEIGVNATPLLKYVTCENPTYFFRVRARKIGDLGKGNMIACSLLDYRNDPTTPIETIATFNKVELIANSSSIASMRPVKIIPPVITDPADIIAGVNTSIACGISKDSTKAELVFNSSEKATVVVDLIRSGRIIKTFMIKEIESGVVREFIDFSGLAANTYIIRIMAGNRIVYKTLILK
jgi:hypothetical protein